MGEKGGGVSGNGSLIPSWGEREKSRIELQPVKVEKILLTQLRDLIVEGNLSNY